MNQLEPHHLQNPRPPITNTISSFYRSSQSMLEQNPKSVAAMAHNLDYQNREMLQQLQKQSLTLQMKNEQMVERFRQWQQKSQGHKEQLERVYKDMGNKYKTRQKEDETKEWTVQMEKSIGNVIGEAQQANRKIIQKCVIQYQNIQNICANIEQQVREQRKERQREWEELIDNVGETIIEAEAIVQDDRHELQNKLICMQSLVFDMEEEGSLSLQIERSSRKREHEYLTKLIQKIMDKLILH